MTQAFPHPLTRPAPSQIVEEVLALWPQTIPVFLKHRMACPGCAMAKFQTVTEAAQSYGVEPAELLADLAHAIAGNAPEGPFLPPAPHSRTS
ncbi:MAG TPA: DUF1858 domain-containing protein [Azospirillum sp.]|nr:DUF1858 domain-containing protein [Azospirillum sp.]